MSVHLACCAKIYLAVEILSYLLCVCAHMKITSTFNQRPCRLMTTVILGRFEDCGPKWVSCLSFLSTTILCFRQIWSPRKQRHVHISSVWLKYCWGLVWNVNGVRTCCTWPWEHTSPLPSVTTCKVIMCNYRESFPVKEKRGQFLSGTFIGSSVVKASKVALFKPTNMLLYCVALTQFLSICTNCQTMFWFVNTWCPDSSWDSTNIKE